MICTGKTGHGRITWNKCKYEANMKRLFDKWGDRMWTLIASFRIVSSSGFYSEYSNDTKASIQERKFIFFAIIRLSKWIVLVVACYWNIHSSNIRNYFLVF
jgi:hypothetical protein